MFVVILVSIFIAMINVIFMVIVHGNTLNAWGSNQANYLTNIYVIIAIQGT